MSLYKSELINKIKISYQSFYDILYFDENVLDDTKSTSGIFMNAQFHMHSENYVISRKAQLYQMDTNEYVHFYYYEKLTKDLFENAVNETYDDSFPKINPGPDHRSSYITAVFICKDYDEDALIALKKYRRRKSFQFSLHGWLEVHTAIVDLRSESVFSNSDGRPTGKFLKNILRPKRRKRFIFF